MKPPYFLLENDHPTGPHSLIVLRQKADIRVIGPDARVRPAGAPDAPWLPVRDLPDLHALLFPPKVAPVLRGAPLAADHATDRPFRAVAVDQLLHQNAAALAATDTFDPGAIPSRRARRHRRYLLTVLAFAAPAWAAHRFALLPRTDMSLVLLASFVALAALLSYWIIYHISDFRS